jgi:competence protein ComEC
MSRILFIILIIGIASFRVSTVFLQSNQGKAVRTIPIARVLPERNGKQYVDIEGDQVALPQSVQVKLGDTLRVITETSQGRTKVISASVITTTNPIYIVRNQFIQFILSHSPSPLGEVSLGMVVGSRDILSDPVSSYIKKAGITHLLVASGTNIAIVVSFFSFLLIPITGRLRAIPFVIAVVWLYTMVVGFEPAIVRSALTFTAVGVVSLVGLYIPTIAILFWMFWFFIIVTPSVILDVGFYLSFFAVAGILLLDSYFYRLIRFVSVVFIRKSISTSLAASLAVAPISLLVFKSFPVVTIISTLLTSWVSLPIIFLTVSAYLLSFVSNTLATLLLLISFPFSQYFLFVAKLVGSL